MALPGRTTPAAGDINDKYRYSHNGQEKDKDIFIGALSAEFWEYDSRTGRRWETDPIVQEWESPYACFGNNPIYYSDILGLKKGGRDKERIKGNHSTRKHVRKGERRKRRQERKEGREERREKRKENRKDKGNPESTPSDKQPTEKQKDKKHTPRVISVQINHGSNGQEGGPFGGHVVVVFDDAYFSFSGPTHLFPHKKNPGGYISGNKNQTFNDMSVFLHNPNTTLFSTTVSEEEYEKLYNAYIKMKNAPHGTTGENGVPDYAFFGKRCASHAFSMLTNAGIIKGNVLLNWFNSMNPGAVYRYLKRHNWDKTIENTGNKDEKLTNYYEGFFQTIGKFFRWVFTGEKPLLNKK